MNREKKFRAWDKENDCWLDPEHFYITGDGRPFTCQQGRHNISCRYEQMGTNRYVVEQYIGLKAHGVELYGGDVIEFDNSEIGGKKYVGEIIRCDDQTLDNLAWGLWTKKGYLHTDFLGKIKILGNVHENPKLLKEIE